MSYREFRDDSGVRWEVWEVLPALLEWRVRDDKARDDIDRRAAGRKRAPVAHELRFGWLVFEADGAKRRLAPVPAGWESMADEELRVLLGRADAASRPRLALSIDSTMTSPPVQSVSSGPARP